VEEFPFKGYMPLANLVDWLTKEFEERGNVWVQINGTIRGTDIAVVRPDGMTEIPQNRPV
jgi:hypothetical protein